MATDEFDGLTACERYRSIVNDRFRFLTTYGFEEAETGCAGAEIWVVFRNEVSQINVHFEYGCAVWLTVGRSVNGEQFNLNYLLRLRAPDRERLQAVGNSFDPQQIDEIMRERSDTLREYADDLLRGDFTVFPKLREGQNEQSAEKFRRLEARGLWP